MYGLHSGGVEPSGGDSLDGMEYPPSGAAGPVAGLAYMSSDCEEYDSSCSGGGGGGYEDELHMAAIIGKKLLERNAQLEHELQRAVSENANQAREIDLLAKQVSEMRETEKVRALMYEQWDLARIQVERDNNELLAENQAKMKLIANLNFNIEQLQEKCASMDVEMTRINVGSPFSQRSDSTSGSPPPIRKACDHPALKRCHSMEQFTFGTDPLVEKSDNYQELIEKNRRLHFQKEKTDRINRELSLELQKVEQENLMLQQEVHKYLSRIEQLEHNEYAVNTMNKLLRCYLSSKNEGSKKSLEDVSKALMFEGENISVIEKCTAPVASMSSTLSELTSSLAQQLAIRAKQPSAKCSTTQCNTSTQTFPRMAKTKRLIRAHQKEDTDVPDYRMLLDQIYKSLSSAKDIPSTAVCSSAAKPYPSDPCQ